MIQAATRQAVARILAQTAGDLAIARANDHARRLVVAARRAGAEAGIAPAARFQALLAAGRPRAALQTACRILEATADPTAGTRPRNLARDLALHRLDAELREMVFATVTHPARRKALLPILERIVGDASGAVVPLSVYMLCAIKAGRSPNFDLASSLLWTAALQWLFKDHPPELLQAISRQLRARFPEADFLAKLDDILNAAPPVPTGAAPFRDKLGAAVQFVPARRPDEKVLLVCFCGKGGQIGMPVNYFHRWTQRVPAHVLYLRDMTRDFFTSGIAELGPDWVSLLEFIRGLAGALGIERLATYGHSMGGFPAIRAGVELPVARAASVSGRADHDTVQADRGAVEAARQRWIRMIGTLPEAAAPPPEIACAYGAGNSIDAGDAQALAGLAGVRLVPLPGHRLHNAGIKLATSGGLERMLAWLVGASDDLSMD